VTLVQADCSTLKPSRAPLQVYYTELLHIPCYVHVALSSLSKEEHLG
jgi:hypothetical protein